MYLNKVFFFFTFIHFVYIRSFPFQFPSYLLTNWPHWHLNKVFLNPFLIILLELGNSNLLFDVIEQISWCNIIISFTVVTNGLALSPHDMDLLRFYIPIIICCGSYNKL